MPSKPWERDPYNPYRYYRSLSEHLHKYQAHDKALLFNQKAESFAKTTDQKIPLYIKRCHQHFLLANSQEGEQDVRKLKRMAPRNLDAKHIHALELYYKDNLEEALKEFYRGIFLRVKPDNFTSWVKVTMGTLEDCVGESVGDIMSPKILGKSIVKMKMIDLKIIPPYRALPEVLRVKKAECIAKNKKCYAEKYLGLVAQDKFFLNNCLVHPAMYLTNKKHNDLIYEILNTTIDKVDVKQESLWRRKPLYFWSNKTSRVSKYMEKMEREVKIEKSRLLREDCKRQIIDVFSALRKGNFVECYKKGEMLRSKVFDLSERDFPMRDEYLDCIIITIGMLNASQKNFIPDWSQSQNDERIYFMNGIFRPYQPCHELFRESFHPIVTNPQSYMKKMTEGLSLCRSGYEKLYFAYEAGFCCSLKRDLETMRIHARTALNEASRLNDYFWYLSSLFLLAKTEFHDSNLHEAEVYLTCAKDFANLKDLHYIGDFAQRGITLARQLTDEELRGRKGLDKRAGDLVDNMVSMDLKINCSKILKRMETLPTEMRMSLIPGLKPLKRRKQKKTPPTHEEEEAEKKNEEMALAALVQEARRRKTLQFSETMLKWGW